MYLYLEYLHFSIGNRRLIFYIRHISQKSVLFQCVISVYCYIEKDYAFVFSSFRYEHVSYTANKKDYVVRSRTTHGIVTHIYW